MKIYKILGVYYNHGVSVFPTEDQDLPESEDIAGEPIGEFIRQIMMKGYTEHEAWVAVQAWAYHAKFDLNQTANGVRTYVGMCVREIPLKGMPPEPILWGLIALVASIVAVALALYVWVLLDQEFNLVTQGHEWAYVMTFANRIWAAEVLNVGYRQQGYYEQGGDFGVPVNRFGRGGGGEPRKDWIDFSLPGIVVKGRRLIFYHEYQVIGFSAYFCGVGTKVGDRLYKLREGGDDPHLPWGPWTRPGGRMFTDGYAGCWKEFWWF